MAQSSSAQREPSMEEILASIRRIIEDSDAEKKSPGDSDMPPAVAANDESQPGKGIEAFRSELREEQTLKPDWIKAAEPEFDDSNVTAAQVVPMSEFLKPGEGDDAAPAGAEVEDASETPEPEVDFSELSTAVEQHFDTLSVADEDSGEQSMTSDQSDQASVSEALPEAPAVSPPESQPRSPILSERSGRQVAAAFGELSEAFAASRRRSFDEMAEEMMRPMLQDWLDNNLPHLVEKLVREEIERIARG
jgi:cell pole-organizing protein PopZ